MDVITGKIRNVFTANLVTLVYVFVYVFFVLNIIRYLIYHCKVIFLKKGKKKAPSGCIPREKYCCIKLCSFFFLNKVGKVTF